MEPKNFNELLGRYFYSYPANDEVRYSGLHVRKEYFNLGDLRQSLEASDRWHKFYDSVKRIHGIRKVREFNPTKHSIKILCALENSMSNGIGVYLSLLGGFYGFYYISETNMYKTECFGMEYNAYLSYYPLTDELRDVSNQVEKLLTREFPEFEKFDNKWADYPIENIQSYYSFKEKTTLFELIFEEQPGGIFF
ncbi:hypothetical protein LQ567_24175 [Niabella pedocola]|uniref:Uncharacterized protein n=1 Tax=Niabella pedocola TaxID=1752077 RepID=A0ABS8PXW2_9BACT|nr:hypothetical protein [Niabella pedocola]MCD2425902.1 hypothetical protein [Niabella pedocola]